MLEVLNLNENNCADCYKCIRTCSVKAITYANNTAEIVHDECILCGNCFVACPQKAKQVRNDVPRVKEAIAAGRHVVCSLAPSFIADFRIRSLDVMTDALKRLGFAEVQETGGARREPAPDGTGGAHPCFRETMKKTERTVRQQAVTMTPSTCSPASSQPRNTPMTGLTYS